jgi:hypothetical protein
MRGRCGVHEPGRGEVPVHGGAEKTAQAPRE